MKVILRISAIILAGCVLAGTVQAQQRTSEPRQHIVKAGETLYAIARQYDVSLTDLKSWNHLPDNAIQVGQRLWVSPPGDDETGARPTGTIRHTVVSGETLFSLARKYDVTVADLRKWNNLSDNTLTVGQRLVIHAGSSSGGAGRPGDQFSGRTPTQTKYYTVKSGDYLTLIAQRFNMTVQELKQMNGLTSDVIHVGQQLKVRTGLTAPSVADNTATSSPQGRFATYKATRTLSVPDLLKRFGMDENDFRALNPDWQGGSVRRGQEVLVLLPPTNYHKNPYRIDNRMSGINTTPARVYPDKDARTPTTSGELYNPQALTAGSATMPLGEVVYVQNPSTDKGLYVVINDRVTGEYIELSREAYELLGLSGSQPQVKVTEVK